MGESLVGRAAPEALRHAEVQDAEGKTQRLGDVFDGRVTILVFVRHFGCVGCDMHVTALAEHLFELSDLGAHTAIIGNGAPRYLAAFADRHKLAGQPVTLWTAPDLEAYRAANLDRALGGALGARALWAQLLAIGEGYRQGAVHGDLSQQGGVLLLDADGTVRLHHQSRRAGDNLPVGELVAALASPAAARLEQAGVV